MGQPDRKVRESRLEIEEQNSGPKISGHIRGSGDSHESQDTVLAARPTYQRIGADMKPSEAAARLKTLVFDLACDGSCVTLPAREGRRCLLIDAG